MKRLKYLLLLIILIPFNVYASQIKKDTIDVTLHSDGTASVVEKWDVSSQRDTYFQKDFFNASDIEISNIKIVNKNGTEYTNVKKLNKDDRKTYTLVTHPKYKSLKVVLDTYKDDTYTITYDVKGMIKKYKNDVYGLDFTFVGINYSMKIDSVLITIKSDNPFMETNTALFGIGKDLALSITDGNIIMNTFTYDNKSLVRLFTKFTDLTFDNVVEKDATFEEIYEKARNENSYVTYILNMTSVRTFIIIGVVIILTIGIIVLAKVIANKKSGGDFAGIDVVNNQEIPKLDEVDYYKDVPILNLYKVSFLASYFKIARNRSDLVGGIILSWIYKGVIDVFPKDAKPFIRLNYDSVNEDYQLDRDIYSMLRESSTHNIIDGTKLDRFSSSHYLRVMTWYNMGVSNVLTDEIMVGSVKRVSKMGKMHLELQNQIVTEAIRLQGLKKYLLNFNQVPREDALTEKTYKNLLINAEVLGIGEQVAKEILRKNPNNVYAQKLLDLENVRFIYRGFYSKANDKYKLINKNNLTDISSLNQEIDQIVSQIQR